MPDSVDKPGGPGWVMHNGSPMFVPTPENPCPRCGTGDAHYAAPGRGHAAGCDYPLPEGFVVQANADTDDFLFGDSETPKTSGCPNCGHEDHPDRCPEDDCPCPFDIDLDIVHLRKPDGRCVISVNGQGHFPCTEH